MVSTETGSESSTPRMWTDRIKSDEKHCSKSSIGSAFAMLAESLFARVVVVDGGGGNRDRCRIVV